MSKLRLLVWITALVAASVVIMHLLFLKNQSVHDTTIHIVQSLNIDWNKHKKHDFDPHGNVLGNRYKIEEIVPDIVEKEKDTKYNYVTVGHKSQGKTTGIVIFPKNATSNSNIEPVQSAIVDEPIEETEKPGDAKADGMCRKRGENLEGSVVVDQRVPEMEDITKEFSVDFNGWVEKGGKWKPKKCKARAKVAIIIPFRKREPQLKIFLKHMHPILHRQLLHYQIFVIEQARDDPFNRAGLFNIGFKEALKADDFDCFVFSDVDLLPEDDRNYYGCPTSPRHMSAAVDKFDYRLPYESIFGGVGAFKRADFEKINGFSNMFWGWGGEDDDLFSRITTKNLQLTRPSMQVAKYTMIQIHHFQSHGEDPNRHTLLETSAERMANDGLNTLKYRVKKTLELPLVTVINVVLSKSMYSDSWGIYLK